MLEEKSERTEAAKPAAPAQKVVLPRAPTLYAIIAFKLLKGVFFVVLAIILYNLSDNNLPADYDNLLHFLKINPERTFWSELADKVADLTQREVMQIALGTFIYSLFALVEGIGLMFRWSWAGWLAIGESAFFIPIEVHHLINTFSGVVFVILVLNIFMVWYLFANRERLFRHHHH